MQQTVAASGEAAVPVLQEINRSLTLIAGRKENIQLVGQSRGENVYNNYQESVVQQTVATPGETAAPVLQEIKRSLILITGKIGQPMERYLHRARLLFLWYNSNGNKTKHYLLHYNKTKEQQTRPQWPRPQLAGTVLF